MNCPKCGGPCWDNRLKKKNPKQPDFRCKKADCLNEKGQNTALWLSSMTPEQLQQLEPLPIVPAAERRIETNDSSRQVLMIMSYAKDFAEPYQEGKDRLAPDVASELVKDTTADWFAFARNLAAGITQAEKAAVEKIKKTFDATEVAATDPKTTKAATEPGLDF